MTDKLSDNGLIHAEDLYYLLGANNNIKLLDATYSVAAGNLSPFQAFLGKHIDGAQFFDIDVVADQEAPLPHTLPSADYFAACLSALGIEKNDHVVIYDQSGAYMASSRAWWMFRCFSHENVYVLEGGLGSWIANGFPVTEGAPQIPEPSRYTAEFRPELVVGRNDLMNNLETGAIRVLDARPASRFNGDAAEPRPGMRVGHIPRSHNIPFGMLLDARTGHFRRDDELDRIFSELDLAPDDNIAVSCGSGVTACTVALALYKLRRQNAAIYDGSWSEWGDESSGTPIELSA